jgi:hypothetical protein
MNVRLQVPPSRPCLFGAGLAMMADNIEHGITYWARGQKFHSVGAAAVRSGPADGLVI